MGQEVKFIIMDSLSKFSPFYSIELAIIKTGRDHGRITAMILIKKGAKGGD
jgi:hypothetical protein